VIKNASITMLMNIFCTMEFGRAAHGDERNAACAQMQACYYSHCNRKNKDVSERDKKRKKCTTRKLLKLDL
jgi:hypothetical protein